MNIERATGVVLRVRALTETSLIVNWLTRDIGRVATVAKGARRPKSPFRGQIDLFYLAEMAFARSRRSDLHTLRETRLLESHSALRTDLGSLRQASYCAALIEQTTETETPIPALFEQFTGLLVQLPKQHTRPQAVFAFEIKLLEELGLRPNLPEANLTAGSRQILEQLAGRDWPGIFQLRLSAAQATEIRLFLHGFLIYHLDRIPRGRNRALESI
ncbi:MAG TPA: DNA repair protein RecO [Verrucomicrobiae bacterium]|jgi:DNA repair protein RecO (recombination protein O)|nr:DNA repair protein RecO [Verrucomicrobiae bacterium]